MNGTLLVLLATTTVGIDVGWQPLDNGGVEYIIQIDPETLSTVQREGFTVEVPPQIRNIHRFQVVVGYAELPRQAPTFTDMRPPSLEETPLELPGYPAARPSGPTARGQSGNTSSRSGTGSSSAANPGTSTSRTGTSSRLKTPVNSKKSAVPPTRDPFAPEPDAAKPDWASWPSEPAKLGSKNEETNPWLTRAGATEDAPLEERTVAVKASSDDASKAATGEKSAAATKTPAVAESGKPWLPLTITLLLLFASLGGNIYLGWLNVEGRARYRNLLSQVQGKAAA